MKKFEFSKLIFWLVFILTAAVSVFSMVSVVIMQDSTVLGYLIPAVFAEFATSTAFYYNKAKLENKIKLVKSNQVDVTSEDFKEDV